MRRLTRRQRISALVLAAVALCFITLDLGGGALRDAHTGVRGTLGALYRGTDAVLGPVRRWVQGVPGAATSEQRIAELRQQNAAVRHRIDQLQTDRRISDQLSALQRAADRRGDQLLPARVVALGPGQGFDWTLTLDAGTTDGVRVGQTVTDGAALLGRVLHADDSSCVVLLAADPGSGVGVRDLRTGEIGVATGAGPAGFTFRPLNPAAVVRVGDRLVTGPTGSTSYAAGLEVGTVRSVRSSADGTQTASVRPATSPTAVELVAVVLGTGGSGSLAARGGR